jgi:hypothetical protein
VDQQAAVFEKREVATVHFELRHSDPLKTIASRLGGAVLWIGLWPCGRDAMRFWTVTFGTGDALAGVTQSVTQRPRFVVTRDRHLL